MSYIYNFEKLEVWKQARLFVVDIYTLTRKYPAEEKFGLCSQMQRASVSIILNITEGTSRFSDKEKIRFTEIAYTSLMEVLTQLYVSIDLEYISQSQLDALKVKIDLIAIQLNGLVKSYKNRANNKEKVFSKLSKFVMMKMGVKFVDILKSIIILISIDSNQIILLFYFVML